MELNSKENLGQYLAPFNKKNYYELFEAIEKDNLIIFLGAGFSKLFGPPLWNELAIKIAEGIFTPAELDILTKEATINPRKVISISYDRYKKDNKLETYKEVIKENLKISKKEVAKSLYEKIFKLEAKTYITTNIDLSLLEEKNKIKKYDCTNEKDSKGINNNLKDGNIIFLHGSVENVDEAILTVDQYLKHYKNQEIVKLLENIFTSKNIVLFIGYSLSEWEIIEKIYRTIGKQERNAQNICQGYLFTPLFSHEYTKYKLDEIYFNFFNIKMIPYFIDYDGYEKIGNILDDLIKSCDKHKPSPMELLGEIDEITKYAK